MNKTKNKPFPKISTTLEKSSHIDLIIVRHRYLLNLLQLHDKHQYS